MHQIDVDAAPRLAVDYAAAWQSFRDAWPTLVDAPPRVYGESVLRCLIRLAHQAGGNVVQATAETLAGLLDCCADTVSRTRNALMEIGCLALIVARRDCQTRTGLVRNANGPMVHILPAAAPAPPPADVVAEVAPAPAPALTAATILQRFMAGLRADLRPSRWINRTRAPARAPP
jgi:hypothetical protein